MKKNLVKSLFKVIAVFVLILNFQALQGQTKYQLVWADEFNVDGAINPNFWNMEVRDDGCGNNELQYYTNRTENIKVDGGKLLITARKESYLGKSYTSARITTQKKVNFKYGKIEARMKLPYGKGMWPAFWMLGESISTVGWPNCGEIDIMELVGGTETNDRTTNFTTHWGPYAPDWTHPMIYNHYELPSGKFADDFHVFSVEWDSKTIKGFCDNIEYYTFDVSTSERDAFHGDFFILFNLAVGGNWPGSPDDNTVFPQTMEVDYVRVYKKTNDF